VQLDLLPIWSRMSCYGNARPEDLLYEKQPITTTINPIRFWRKNTAHGTMRPLAFVLAFPSSVITIERFWNSNKVWDARRNKLDMETGSTQLLVQQTWRIAREMLARGDLSKEGIRFYEQLLPWGLKK
jgi:hypothetical protein